MLSITFEAKSIIDAEHDRRPLRLKVSDDGAISLAPDRKRSEDLTYSHEGDTLLLVDVNLAQSLDGMELGTEREAGRSRVILRDRRSPRPGTVL